MSRFMKWYVASLVALMMAGCGKAAIEPNCTMNGFGAGTCSFTNTGTGSGSVCGVVEVSVDPVWEQVLATSVTSSDGAKLETKQAQDALKAAYANREKASAALLKAQKAKAAALDAASKSEQMKLAVVEKNRALQAAQSCVVDWGSPQWYRTACSKKKTAAEIAAKVVVDLGTKATAKEQRVLLAAEEVLRSAAIELKLAEVRLTDATAKSGGTRLMVSGLKRMLFPPIESAVFCSGEVGSKATVAIDFLVSGVREACDPSASSKSEIIQETLKEMGATWQDICRFKFVFQDEVKETK